MKTLLLSALLLTISAGAQARSILVFKTVSECKSYELPNPMLVTVQEAQDGQSQIIIKLENEEEAPVVVQTRKIIAPKMSAGTPTRYVGKDPESGADAILAIGTRPMKVGKVSGRVATIELKGSFKFNLLCSAVK